ncbi:efflux RND transporter periplasmic adaptor subunit [Sorangium sp. So ce233]|uniref:efflux RND transporter periplasmic adaptor subunit n=1 Tax=Sorangium sp. So ce233 TaxID=3133290 RepID=UPI003F645D44
MSTTTTSSRAGSLLLLAALAAAASGCATKASASDAPGATEAAAPPVRVETAPAREAPMPRSLALTGTLRGDQQTDLAANAAGRVLETFVERGAEVKKGDLLARLDVRAAALTAAEAQANAALTRAQEETARRECDRTKALLESGAISRAEHDRIADQCRSAPLSVAAAAARARAASQSVGDGQIRAPFDGTITERFVDVGEYVRHDSPVVALVSKGAPRLSFSVPEASLAAVRPGGALTFTVPAYPGRSFAGTVRWIGGAVRETTRDLVAEAEVQDPDGALRPGMFASIALATGEAPSLVVPRSSVVPREGRAHLFVVVDRRLEERVVQLGAEKGDAVAVLRGVRAGEAIVIHPSEALRNGQAVE